MTRGSWRRVNTARREKGTIEKGRRLLNLSDIVRKVGQRKRDESEGLLTTKNVKKRR